jgi:hypothetical protein
MLKGQHDISCGNATRHKYVCNALNRAVVLNPDFLVAYAQMENNVLMAHVAATSTSPISLRCAAGSYCVPREP